MDHTRVKLGEGEAVFERSRAALERWEQFRLGWVEAWPPETTNTTNTAAAICGPDRRTMTNPPAAAPCARVADPPRSGQSSALRRVMDIGSNRSADGTAECFEVVNQRRCHQGDRVNRLL